MLTSGRPYPGSLAAAEDVMTQADAVHVVALGLQDLVDDAHARLAVLGDHFLLVPLPLFRLASLFFDQQPNGDANMYMYTFTIPLRYMYLYVALTVRLLYRTTINHNLLTFNSITNMQCALYI